MKRVLFVLLFLLGGCSVQEWELIHADLEEYRLEHAGASKGVEASPTTKPPFNNPYKERFSDWSS